MTNAREYRRECLNIATRVVRALDYVGRDSRAFKDESILLRQKLENRPDYTQNYESSWSLDSFMEAALHNFDRGYWSYAGASAAAYFISLPDLTVHIIGDHLGPAVCTLPEKYRRQLVDERFRTDTIAMIADVWDRGYAAGVQSGLWEKAREVDEERRANQALRKDRPEPVFRRIMPKGARPARLDPPRVRELKDVVHQMSLFDILESQPAGDPSDAPPNEGSHRVDARSERAP